MNQDVGEAIRSVVVEQQGEPEATNRLAYARGFHLSYTGARVSHAPSAAFASPVQPQHREAIYLDTAPCPNRTAGHSHGDFDFA